MNEAPESSGLEPDDAVLMRRVQERDAGALEILFRRYSRLVYLVGCRVCRQEADADALVVTVFHELWSHPRKYDPRRGPVRTYLMLLANSRATDRIRLVTRQRQGGNAAMVELHKQSLQRQESSDPAVQLEEADLKIHVRESIESLPPEMRQVLEMSFLNGQTHEEVAASLSVPLGTVKSRIRRGLQRFREHWIASREEPDEP